MYRRNLVGTRSDDYHPPPSFFLSHRSCQAINETNPLFPVPTINAIALAIPI